MTRREFIPLAASVTASFAATFEVQPRLRAQGWQVALTPSGNIASFRRGQLELVSLRLPNYGLQITFIGGAVGEVLGGKKVNVCEHPTRSYQRDATSVSEFQFHDPHTMTARLETELHDLGNDGVALTQRVVLTSEKPIHEQILVQLPRAIQLPHQTRKVFLPMKNGIGKTKEIRGLDNEDDYVYELSGSCGSWRPQLLAVPMVQESSDASEWKLTHCTDPLFTSLFRLPFADQVGQVQWIYPSDPGLPAEEEVRTIYTIVHNQGPDGAMRAFYQTALAEVKPGPDWLHDVAMVDYDYLSKNGRGWFADIDKLTELIKIEDRPKVLLALHGWYDLVGRYTFEPQTQSFRQTWTAFPNARSSKVQGFSLGTVDTPIPDLLDTPGYVWPRKSVEALEPVSLSVNDLHRRIRYAKTRGFRVALYFADGLNASDSLKGIYSPDKVLRWGGWEGPDTDGRVYAQNPIHPEVRAFYVGYVKALLHEYGKELDGFVWDETYTVPPRAIGSAAAPGYADRALMTLIREVASAVAAYPNLAFLSSDNIGFGDQVRNAPYCLMAHGTYQDSQCRPEAWSYALFPNFRNAFWSCNWGAVSNFEFMKFGVDTFDTPVAISNGAFGDDIGISEMNALQIRKIVDLFETRKQRTMRIGWISEGTNRGTLEYAGRRFQSRYNILS
jgi:hypothetical protein